jgi:hypothetical protein
LINRIFNSKAVWPFGLSPEVPDSIAEVEKLFHPVNITDESVSSGGSPIISKSSPLLDDIPDPFLMGALAAAKVTISGGEDMRDRDGIILGGVDGALTAVMIFSGNKRKRLPCWVLIKFRALQGILPTLNRVFGHIQEGERKVFRYGLPQPVLDVALLWQPEGKCERRQHCEDCNQPCMPSWSWAGWVGKKHYRKTFSPRTNNKGALVKLVVENGLERIRPLVRFYARGAMEWERRSRATFEGDKTVIIHFTRWPDRVSRGRVSIRQGVKFTHVTKEKPK